MADVTRPNIVFIITDDTPPEGIGCYGAGDGLTPTIDKLAGEGTVFDQAYCTSSVCQPSRYSYLTGTYAGRCPDSVYRTQQPETQPYSVEFNVYVNEQTPSMGDIFQNAGYRTGISGKWHAGHHIDYEGPELLTIADLDSAETDIALKRYQQRLVDEVKRTGGYDFAGGMVWGNNDSGPRKALCSHHIEWSMQAVCDFLDTCSADQPFLLHYASTCYHGPNAAEALDYDPRYTPGGRVDAVPDCIPSRESIRTRLSDAGLEINHHNVSMMWIDDQVAAIVNKLRQRDLLDNTIIVFCCDHGVEPGKSTCYERGIRIPMLMWKPGLIPQGNRVAAGVQNVDMMPTLLDLAGETADAPFDGRSVVPLVNGEKESVRDELFFENGYFRAVRTDTHKYIALRYPAHLLAAMRQGEFSEAPNHLNRRKQVHAQIAIEHYPCYFDADQLYDLENDPGEQRNLAADSRYAEVLADMKQHLAGYLETFDHPYDLEDTAFLKSEAFKELAERTRAIGTGYISWWNGGH